MNRKQKLIVCVALVLFVITLSHAPWNITETIHRSKKTMVQLGQYDIDRWTETRVRTEYAPVWSPPTSGNVWLNESACHLRSESLVIEWIGIGVIGLILFRIFRDKP